MELLTSTKKEAPSYVTPGTYPPDMANGDFIAFSSDNGIKTFFQVTNDSNVWFKIVTSEGIVTNTSTFTGDPARMLLKYIQMRMKEIEESAGAKIEPKNECPLVKWFDASKSFPPKKVDAEDGEQKMSVDVLVYTKDGAIINAWFDYERSGWYCFGVGKHKGKEEHLTDVLYWCYPPVLPIKNQF